MLWRNLWSDPAQLRSFPPTRILTNYHKPHMFIAYMKAVIKDYLAQIGRRGGLKSRRSLNPDHARRMVAVREARRAFARYKAQCFWSYRPDWIISLEDVPAVIEQLQREGNREAFMVARHLQQLWRNS